MRGIHEILLNLKTKKESLSTNFDRISCIQAVKRQKNKILHGQVEATAVVSKDLQTYLISRLNFTSTKNII